MTDRERRTLSAVEQIHSEVCATVTHYGMMDGNPVREMLTLAKDALHAAADLLENGSR